VRSPATEPLRLPALHPAGDLARGRGQPRCRRL